VLFLPRLTLTRGLLVLGLRTVSVHVYDNLGFHVRFRRASLLSFVVVVVVFTFTFTSVIASSSSTSRSRPRRGGPAVSFPFFFRPEVSLLCFCLCWGEHVENEKGCEGQTLTVVDVMSQAR
jgi:ABC-type Fe3+ transport system permease subunit